MGATAVAALPPLWTRALVLASVAHFLHGLSLHLYVHLPAFLRSLGESNRRIGAVYAVTAAVAIAVRPWVGRVMDRRGRRQIILWGGAMHVLACAAYLGVSAPGAWLVAARALHGVAEGMLFASLFTYAADIVPIERRTEGIAAFGVSGLLPMSVGGLLGDAVLARAGYPQLFALSALVALGGLLASLALVEATRAPTATAPRGIVAASLDRALFPIWLLGLCFSLALAAVFTFLKNFLVETGVGSTGAFLTAYALSASALRLALGSLPDRFGPRRVLVPAVLALTLGIALLSRAGTATEVVVAGVLAGLGHGFTFPILAGLVVTRTPDADRGSALSVFTALFDLGILVGGPLFGALADGLGYGTAFSVAAAQLGLGLGVAAWMDRKR